MSDFESSRTPVIIPAHNEEEYIACTLSALPQSLVEPLVVVNGSSDRTAEIARGFGAAVIDLPEQGKLPAIQTAMRQLGVMALEPVLILDADTRPLAPKLWARGMVRQLQDSSDEQQPVAVGGPVWYTKGETINNTLRSLRRFVRAIETRAGNNADTLAQCGPNMGIHLKNSELLEAVLSLPHYWPSEDRALAAEVIEAGGAYHQPLSPTMLTLSPASVSFLSLSETRSLGLDVARQKMLDLYAQRGAPDSIPYPGKINQDL